MDKEVIWAKLKRRLGYTDEQLTRMRNDPRWRAMVEDTPEFNTHKIIVEVIKSEGCVARHRVGDRFVLDANGCLLTEESPKKVCLYALAPLVTQVAAVYERLTAKLPPEGLIFDRAHCLDVGPECGGWGQILMKATVVGPEQR